MFYQRICHLNMQYKKVYGIRAPAGSVSRVREILRVMNSSPMLDVELTLEKKKKSLWYPGAKIYFPKKYSPNFTVKIKGKTRFYVLNLLLLIIINSLHKKESPPIKKIYQKVAEHRLQLILDPKNYNLINGKALNQVFYLRKRNIELSGKCLLLSQE